MKNIFNFFLDLWLSVFSPPTILILFHEVECCYILNVCLYPTAKFFLWNLITKLMVFWGEVFGRWFGHESEALVYEISILRKEASESSPNLSSTWYTVRKRPSAGPHQTLNLLVPWSWTSWPPELRKSNFCVYKPPRLYYSVIASWMDEGTFKCCTCYLLNVPNFIYVYIYSYMSIYFYIDIIF